MRFETRHRQQTHALLPSMHSLKGYSRHSLFIVKLDIRLKTVLQADITLSVFAIKNHVVKYMYCETVYDLDGKNIFWSIKSSGEILNKLKSKCHRARFSSI